MSPVGTEEKKETRRVLARTCMREGTGSCKGRPVNDAEMLEQDTVKYPTDCVHSQRVLLVKFVACGQNLGLTNRV